jgi:hypothetical protein
MYINGKMAPVRTSPGMREWGYSIVEGVNSNAIYLICCKSFCQGHNVSTPSTTIKKKRSFMYFYIIFFSGRRINSATVYILAPYLVVI